MLRIVVRNVLPTPPLTRLEASLRRCKRLFPTSRKHREGSAPRAGGGRTGPATGGPRDRTESQSSRHTALTENVFEAPGESGRMTPGRPPSPRPSAPRRPRVLLLPAPPWLRVPAARPLGAGCPQRLLLPVWSQREAVSWARGRRLLPPPLSHHLGGLPSQEPPRARAPRAGLWARARVREARRGGAGLGQCPYCPEQVPSPHARGSRGFKQQTFSERTRQ